MPNELHRRLTSDLLAAESNLAALNERQQRLAALTKQYQAHITTFDVKSLERAELERNRTVQEEAYLLYRKKAQEAEISNVMNQARIANISLAQPPTTNHKAVSPKPLLNLAVLTVVGLLAGVASVLALERNRLSLPARPTQLPAPRQRVLLSNPLDNLALAIDRLQQRERQLVAENSVERAPAPRRPRPLTDVKSLTWLRHNLRRQQ